jgi:death-on-curing protein
MNHNFPTLKEVITIHQVLIEEFGGLNGLRDENSLESALMRPQSGYYQDIIEEAAALMESLALNHPFIDGNKRVAFFVTDTFLRMNSAYINCGNEETYAYFMKLFENDNFRFAELLPWLRNKVQILESN